MKKLKQLTQKFIKANDLHNAALEMVPEVFPIGSEIFYEHGGLLRYVTVVNHSRSNTRILVRGVTGNDYWLSSERVAFEMERNS